MKPDALGTLIDVLRERRRIDDTGASVSQGYYRYHRKLPADVADVVDGKTKSGVNVADTATKTATIRQLRDVKAGDRVLCDGGVYEIVRTIEFVVDQEHLADEASPQGRRVVTKQAKTPYIELHLREAAIDG